VPSFLVQINLDPDLLFTQNSGYYLSKKVVSIDGEKMADLMFQHNLGVEIVDTHEIKKVS
jgi:restriction endonuclease Mrr